MKWLCTCGHNGEDHSKYFENCLVGKCNCEKFVDAYVLHLERIARAAEVCVAHGHGKADRIILQVALRDFRLFQNQAKGDDNG